MHEAHVQRLGDLHAYCKQEAHQYIAHIELARELQVWLLPNSPLEQSPGSAGTHPTKQPC